MIESGCVYEGVRKNYLCERVQENQILNFLIVCLLVGEWILLCLRYFFNVNFEIDSHRKYPFPHFPCLFLSDCIEFWENFLYYLVWERRMLKIRNFFFNQIENEDIHNLQNDSVCIENKMEIDIRDRGELSFADIRWLTLHSFFRLIIVEV